MLHSLISASQTQHCARDTACARFSTFSLLKMCFTCDFTVSGVMARFRAISLLDSPSAINLSMSLSPLTQ